MELRIINIGLSPEEVELFKNFRQYQDLICYMPELKILKEKGFFDFTKGQAICHRDETGKLRKIEYHLISYNE